MEASNHELLSIASRPTAPLFPALNQEEREILSQIISLTSPNTNAFNVLLSPYESTLRRYRIDPKIDDKYYTFLLKLSLVPGSDWKQKWARVSSDRSTPSGLPSHQAVIPAASQAYATNHEPRKINQTACTGPQDKGKRKALTNNAKPDTNQTAVNWNSRPPKSVHFLPTRVEENVHRPTEQPPPTDLCLEPQSAILQSKMTLLVDPIDVKARKFRRQQLLARCLNKWMNSIIDWNTLDSNAQAARRVLDISAAYQTWTRKFRNRQSKLKSVDTSYNTRLLFAHLGHWKKLTVSRTIQKKSLALRNAYRKTKGTRERNLCRQVLIIWANYMKSTRIHDSFRRKLVDRSLRQWYQKLQYLSHLSLASHDLSVKFNSLRLRQKFSHWVQHACLLSKLTGFLHHRDSQVKHQFFTNWNITFSQSRQSNLFLLKSRFYRLLKACKKLRARQRMLEFSESTVMAFRSSNTQLHVLRHWIIRGRGSLFSNFVQKRLIKTRWQQWRRRVAYVRHNLPRLQNQFTVQCTLNLAYHHLQHWIQYQHDLTQKLARAQNIYQLYIIRDSFLAWRFHLQWTRELQVVASSTRINFLQKRVLFVWKHRIQRIKGNSWRQEKMLVNLRGCLITWRLLTRKKRRLSSALSIFQQRIAERQCLNALSHWRVRLVLTTRNKHKALKLARKNLKQRFWEIWTSRYDLIGVFLDESSLVIHRRCQTEKSSLLTYWLDRTRTKVAHNCKLDQFSHRHRRLLILSVWERWRDKTRSRELEPIEQSFNSVRNRNYTTQMMHAWMTRSSLIFLLRRARLNTLMNCFDLWYNLTKLHQIRNQIRLKKNRFIIKFYFSLWCKKSFDLKTLRIISRFKNNTRIAQPTSRYEKRFGAREVTEEDYSTTTSLATSSSNESDQTLR
ncbi:hypothetical protein PtB15_3B135 [Puccinia triticina]|nr:hypothetical protein PtB15_3B135 [Puccinia triticina]